MLGWEQKKIGSTAASKALHLACPDLFVMWDAKIGVKYRCNKYKGNGKEYFKFLTEMKDLGKGLENTINDLQQKYGRRITSNLIPLISK